MTVAPLLSTAAACVLAGAVLGRRAPRLWLAFTSVGALSAFAAAMIVLFADEAWEWRSGFQLGGEPLHLRLDAVSALFLALLGFVGAAATVYAHDYWSDRDYPRSAPWNRTWWNGLLLSMGGVLIASNGLHFLIAWELFALCSFFLITLERQSRAVRAAGWLYLAASHAGTLCLFAFFALLAARTGSWDLHGFANRPELAPLFWLGLVAFGVKAGLFPLHIWLPSAHACAPSHVSALMSGVCIKMGIYGIVRFSGWLPVPPAGGWVVMSLGAVTALLGIAFALGQNDLKRLLAYSSVENIGIILVGLGGGLLGITHGDTLWGRLAFAGAILHVWNHGLFKSLLFFGAGSILHATGTREMSRLGGLWRSMPWTAAAFLIGAVAVCALPPLNGFVSEWLIYLGLFHAAADHTAAAAVAIPAAVMLGVTGALALAAFTKAAATIFLGSGRSPAARRAHDASLGMRVPMFLVAAGCLGLGLAPLLVWPAIGRVLTTWNPAWPTAPVAHALVVLGPAPIVVAGAALVAAAALATRARRGGMDRGPTWDCGYAAPTARMQYTSGSFSGIATGWFHWVLLPERQLQRPRGFFPTEALRLERVPETVLDRGLTPVARVVLVVSNAVRRLQHGRLQFYIAYVLLGVVALTALVTVGSPR